MKNPLPNEIYLERTRKRTLDVRGDFFRDQTAIIHSNAFRRLKHKTQVFFAPDNDHICTRIEHVLHVATIATTICKGLNRYGWELDPDMAYAIGLGHDLGHTPFGHAGEKALNERLKQIDSSLSFIHEVNSYRVVEHLAYNGKGLNLTYGVKDGIISHNGERDDRILIPDAKIKNLNAIANRKIMPSSFEGCIVRLADKIAYLGRDIEDAMIAKYITEKDIPSDVKKALGKQNGKIINHLVIDAIENSCKQNNISFSDDTYQLVTKLKKFNYKMIYNHPELKRYDEFCRNIIFKLFNHLETLWDKHKISFIDYEKTGIYLDKNFGHYLQSMSTFYNLPDAPPYLFITDYISGMTDSFALDAIKQITIPKPILFSY
jgi:dGTPase